MKRAIRRAIATCGLLAVLICGFGLPGAAGSPAVLRVGSQGAEVYEVQNGLYALGFLREYPTGRYGEATLKAVAAFQSAYGLQPDGVVGPATRAALREQLLKSVSTSYTVRNGDTLETVARRFSTDAAALATLNQLSEEALSPGRTLTLPPRYTGSEFDVFRIELAEWVEASAVYVHSSIARVIDVRTARSFLVRRRGGHFHADSEPLTPSDTRAMKEIFGGKWSWERRAVILECRGRWFAASMNGMPHGGEQVSRNGFSGHFCVHFSGSKIHKSGKEDPSHQQMVLTAARFGR